MAEPIEATRLERKIEPLPPITDFDEFVSNLTDRIVQGCQPDEPSIYLLGSHVGGAAIATSDVDLAIVFAAPLTSPIRKKIAELRNTLQESTPVTLDCLVLDRHEISRGLTPNIVQHRLLAGRDVLAGRPLRAQPELMLYYVGLAMGFIQLAYSSPSASPFSLPLAPPAPDDQYLGYTRNGIRTGNGRYRAGLNLLLKLVLAIASFRLAFLRGIFAVNKKDVATQYAEALPTDPWCALVQALYKLAREQLAGELPTSADQQAQLAACCRQVTRFENEFLAVAMTHLPAWLPWADAAFTAQVTETVSRTHCVAPIYREKLDAIKAALELKATTKTATS